MSVPVLSQLAAALLAAQVTAMSPSTSQPAPAPAALTARQVIQRIQQHVGVQWESQTVDTFKAGDPDAPVRGVAVTMMATLDVLRRAADSGCNLVITHEPTFYGHLDETAAMQKERDPVLAAKEAFIKKHGLIVWRFHDHWHMRRPDGVMVGMVKALGWEKHQSLGAYSGLFTLPPTTLEALARDVKQRLRINVVRVVGDPKLQVTHVGLSMGAPGFDGHRRMLQRDDVQVLLMGEAPEWETIEYGTDAAATSRKALIILGHIPSEQAGMEECARWLKGFVTEVPVAFVPTAEPFWTVR